MPEKSLINEIASFPIVAYFVSWFKPFMPVMIPIVLGRFLNYIGVEKRMPGVKEFLFQIILCLVLAVMAQGISDLLNIESEYGRNLVAVVFGISGMNTLTMLAHFANKKLGTNISTKTCDPFEKEENKK